MPKFYTVDRAGSMNVNSIFELSTNYPEKQMWTVDGLYDEKDVIARIEQFYPKGLSTHGIQYLITGGIVIFEEGTRSPLHITYTEPMIEAIFELVRKNEFPTLPSRMQSMFAWLTLEDARRFNESVGNDKSIFEVNSNNAFIADQNLLFLGASVIGAYELARKYWSGDRSNNCKLEAVIPLPAVIGNKI
ncbi:DUF2441 domain-containing protein [Psychrobacter sp. K31L]|uniref:DUF2441 domain-containing protein n=1 Tax=Psychrobacter sp. K31L TaxID=2820758 RepID=UPI001B31905F|nr:DUF2441 domain-containing protein [Psychrobacter sp. K31L]MBP3945202.1 DUF2441 domain-containing protein [Psychrobacter sp. K31L]